MATTVARLEAILSANTRDFDRAMGRSETRMQKVGRAAKVGLGIGVAAGVAVLTDSVKAAMEAERAQKRLETAFKAAKVPIRDHSAAIEDASKAAIKLGFDDEALKDSLGSLIIATGDYKKSQDLANVAMDIARFKGVDLEQATKMLTMAMAGSQRATKQLGIDVPKTTAAYDALKLKFQDVHSEGGKQITQSEKMRLAAAKLTDKQNTAAAVIDTVTGKVKGQADAYSKTAEGSLARFNAQVEELQEKLGEKVLPALITVTDWLTKAAEKFEKVNNFMTKIGLNNSLIDIFHKIENSKVGDVVRDIADAFKEAYGWINKIVGGIKWLIDHIPDLPSLPGWADPRNIGDARNPNFAPPGMIGPTGAAGPASISPSLYDELAGARGFGLTLTSGYRPGAVTSHGTKSDHSYYPSKAIDVAGSPSRMASFFRWLVGQSDVKQAFYDPLGSIFGGVRSSYREGGHSDHVHVATYDRGGWLRPGWNLAYNGLGRPEKVGGGGDVHFYFPNYVGSKSELMSLMQNAARKWRRQNGKGAF